MIDGDLCSFTVAAKLGDERHTPVKFIPLVGDDDCELTFVADKLVCIPAVATKKDPLISPRVPFVEDNERAKLIPAGSETNATVKF